MSRVAVQIERRRAFDLRSVLDGVVLIDDPPAALVQLQVAGEGAL